MKSIQEFLSYLSDLDIRLWSDGERLRCNAPKEVLTPALQAQIVECKAEILKFLNTAHLTASSTLEPIRPVPRDKNVPLSFSQQGLWVIDQLEGSSAAYNQLFAIHLRGSLDIAVLEQVLTEIVRRHEILRTAFINVDQQVVQSISPHPNVKLSVVNLQHLPQSEQWTEIQQMSVAESQRPFDLAQGSLLRVTLFTQASTESVLLFTLHHIISDAWSSIILIKELAALYEAFSKSQPSVLPELSLQYADFANWQQQNLRGSVFEKQLTYWKQKLAGPLPVLQLPSDRPRPAVQTFRGATTTVKIAADVTQRLKKLSQQEGVTLFMTLLAAFKTLLYRYTHQEDICIGTTIANRHNRDLESLIGYFLNTLVMRTDLSGNPSFRELLRRVRDVAWEAYNHQELPFELLVAQLQPKRDLSYTPLFQVMFILENAPREELALPGLTLSFLEMPVATAKFDLTLSMRETQEGLLAKLEYNTDLFDADTIARMAGHLQTLLSAIVANPEQRLRELPLLTETEQHQLLVEWNQTQVNYPQNVCIHQLFEAQVQQTPNAVAVIFENQKLTYRELNTRANQLAHHLQALGVGPDVLVGICVDRSLEMVVGLLGILKAGGAYVPLDPAYPEQRLAFMLSDSRIPVLLTQEKLVTALPKHQAKVVCLDTNWEEIAKQSQHNLINQVSGENLAYVIYTSGSTGQPKGVQIPHCALANFLSAMHQIPGLTKEDILLSVTTLSFDIAGLELYLPLIVGARLVIVSREVAADGTQLLERLVSSNATVMQATPATWRMLLAAGWQGSSRLKILCGGEALDHILANQLLQRGAELWNLYGPTETTIWSALKKVESHNEAERTDGVVSIGRPIANTQFYILDSYLQPVPVGVPGELHIGGLGLARGYFNRPELTAQKFIPNPFNNDSTSRLYKTGDLVCYQPDGSIKYIGRIDHQVKLRGFRIELGEIEALINQHPTVRAAAVVVRSDEPNRERLVAYVVPQSMQTVTIPELRHLLESKLPSYMVPTAFVMLEALPLTPNGKVDRRALPAPDTSRPELDKAFVAPRTPAEVKLAQIWAEFLGVDQVGVYDNFFELGGDSIIGIQIIVRANQAGLQLTTKQLFQHQTIAQLASVAVIKQTTQAEQGLVTGSVPLTPIQHWFFEQNLHEPHYFNHSLVLEVQQALNLVLLEQALQELLLHHDALRLRFEQTKSGWHQVIGNNKNNVIPLTRWDFSTLAKTEQELAFKAAIAELQSRFNLSTEPLARVGFFNFGVEQPSRLLLIIHHLVADVFSWQILLEDLQTTYQQLSQGKKVQLPAKTTSFQYWSECLQDYAQSVTLQQEWDYWLQKPYKQVSSVPVDFPDGDNTVASADTVSIALSKDQTQVLLQQVLQVYNAQINDVLLTALVQAFSLWTGDRSLLVALKSHGREKIFNDVELSRTVGWFTSVFPVVLDLGKSSHPGEALKAIKEQLRSIPNRGMGYGIIRYLSKDAEKAELLRSLPQPEIIFNDFGQVDQTFSKLSLFKFVQESSGLTSSLRNKRSALLEINALVVNSQLQLNLTYSEQIHRRSTIERLAQEFVKALQALITYCQSSEVKTYTPSDFPEANLNQKDLDQFLAKLNRGRK